MSVVDASAVVQLLIDPEEPELRRRIRDGDLLAAPHLIDLEVTQTLRRLLRMGMISEARADEALDDFATLPLTRYSHEHLLMRVWELKAKLTTYDASYIALAELLAEPLVTRDGKYARAVGHHATIHLI